MKKNTIKAIPFMELDHIKGGTTNNTTRLPSCDSACSCYFKSDAAKSHDNASAAFGEVSTNQTSKATCEAASVAAF